MSSIEPVVLVLTTTGSEEQGINIAEALVGAVRSRLREYRQEDPLHLPLEGRNLGRREYLLVIKTRQGLFR